MTKKSYTALVSMILLVVMLVTGCGGAIQQAKTGDTVRVHYTGRLQDGAVFDTSAGSEPLEFTLKTYLGSGQLLKL